MLLQSNENTSCAFFVLLCCVLLAISPVAFADVTTDEEKSEDNLQPTGGRIYVFLALHPHAPPNNEQLRRGLVSIDPLTGDFQGPNKAYGGLMRISPDHQTMAYSADGAIWTNNLQGNSPGKVFDFDGSVCWSPEGREIVCSHGKMLRDMDDKPDDSKPFWRIESWRATSLGAARSKLNVPESDFVIDWSPDAKWLVTTSDRHPPYGDYQLYLMRPDGTEQRRLTTGVGSNIHPRFSPDSRRIVYVHHGKKTSLRIVNVNGKHDRAIFEDDGFTQPQRACWSPDGKQLAVVVHDYRVGDREKDHQYRLLIVDADGDRRREVKLKTEDRILWLDFPEWRLTVGGESN